ncbi:hypothetical protein HD806DRAFT_522284 [Xylariaceae sp. AK1471]|nr:hypothetical protein HD806DRAFT_522284 [Xylariaceae sp. AK1471]
MAEYMAALLLIFPLLLRGASAAPVTPLEAQILAAKGNKTALNTQLALSWATTSNVRSTSDLLWTSILTLSLCVYTVIHINIPPPNEPNRLFYLRKVGWVFVAILAPEFALWLAYQQWDVTRRLKQQLRKIAAEQKGEKLTPPVEIAQRFGWTYCFYAVMGGFVVDVSPIHDYLEYVTIKPQGLVFLAQRGHFIDLSENAIRDKSKADILAKVIVCIQVMWLIIQSIGRKVEGLPIALLEYHVLAHVACALGLYLFWFKKPFDVQEATIVDSSKFTDELALMLLESPCSRESRNLELYNMDTDTHQHTMSRSESITIHNHNGADNPGPDTTEYRYGDEDISLLVGPGQSLENGLGVKKDSDTEVRLNSKDLKRWTKAHRAMEEDIQAYPFGEIKYHGIRYLSKHSSNIQDTSFGDSTAEIQLATKELQQGNRSNVLAAILLIALPAAYGGFHLAAWNHHFPSKVEMWLWRISGLLVATIPTIYSIWDGSYSGIGDAFKENGASETPELLVFCLLFLVYVPARSFLVIEAFMSVRQMPIGVFVTVDWSNYIPHL